MRYNFQIRSFFQVQVSTSINFQVQKMRSKTVLFTPAFLAFPILIEIFSPTKNVIFEKTFLRHFSFAQNVLKTLQNKNTCQKQILGHNK
jgi:hypothetical protein